MSFRKRRALLLVRGRDHENSDQRHEKNVKDIKSAGRRELTFGSAAAVAMRVAVCSQVMLASSPKRG